MNNQVLKKAVCASVLLAGLILIPLLALLPVLMEPGTVFAFNDGNIETVLSPIFRYPQILLRSWDNQFFFGNANVAYPLNTISLLESALGPHRFRREGLLIIIWMTGLAAYWTCRQFGRSVMASSIAAIFMMLCGWSFTFPTVGLPNRSSTLALSALSLGMIERGRKRKSWLCYAIAGGLLGLGVSDTPDVGILFAVCCAVYFFISHFTDREHLNFRAATKRLALFALYVGCSLIIAYQIINTMLATRVLGVTQGSGENRADRYAWATQWSLPKSETWSLIACDFHGASSRSPDSPYWGRMGRTEGWEQTRQGFRDFRLAGYAVGVTPVMLLMILWLYLFRHQDKNILNAETRRSVWIFSAILLISLALSWGKHFPLYRAFYSLPYMGTIRNPDKWLGPFTLFLGLSFSVAIDLVIRLREAGKIEMNGRILRAARNILVVVPAVAVPCLTYLLFQKRQFLESLQRNGYGDLSLRAWENAVGANVQVIIVLILSFALLWLYVAHRRFAQAKHGYVLICLLGAVMSAELLRAGRPFVMGHRYEHISRPNVLTDFLDANRNNGRLKLLPARHALLSNWRMTYLMSKGYDMFDPVTASRLPNDYQAFFDALKNNPIRLWRVGSLRYFLCPTDVVKQLQELDSPLGRFIERLELGVVQSGKAAIPTDSVPANRKFLRIVEFTGALPMFRFAPSWTVLPNDPSGDRQALMQLADSNFDPAQSAIVQSGSVESGTGAESAITMVTNTPAEVSVNVELDGEGLLVRSAKYHSDWKAFIDDVPSQIFRANYLFQAVKVPSGRHRITFTYQPSTNPFIASIVARAFLLIGLVYHIRRSSAVS